MNSTLIFWTSESCDDQSEHYNEKSNMEPPHLSIVNITCRRISVRNRHRSKNIHPWYAERRVASSQETVNPSWPVNIHSLFGDENHSVNGLPEEIVQLRLAYKGNIFRANGFTEADNR